MTMLPIPIERYLVPGQKPIAPAGFTQVDVRILTGLPYPIALAVDLQLIVVLPTGLAVPWRDADAIALVSSSEAELSSFAASKLTDGMPAPLRLVVQQSRQTIGIVPLVAGLRRVVGGQVELVILEWEIRAGSVRGGGDFGSRLSIAWRRTDQATSQFSQPTIHPFLALLNSP